MTPERSDELCRTFILGARCSQPDGHDGDHTVNVGDMRAPERRTRLYLHPDGEYLSIGFDDTNDTLLKLPDQHGAGRDHARTVEWIAAVRKALGYDDES